MKKALAVCLIFLMLFITMGCAVHIHKVGNGGSNLEQVQARQWYALWGLVPINNVDTQQMAGKATDYTIKTETSVLDIVLNVFTSYVTITSRTVTVSK